MQKLWPYVLALGIGLILGASILYTAVVLPAGARAAIAIAKSQGDYTAAKTALDASVATVTDLTNKLGASDKQLSDALGKLRKATADVKGLTAGLDDLRKLIADGSSGAYSDENTATQLTDLLRRSLEAVSKL